MISILYNILFFLVPLVFFKTTSELFEFNKIITLYTFTILISTVWALKSIVSKKIIFRRTILDWPLAIFLFILLLSSIFSIDIRTSIFGYYSRFNGGLLSIISFSLLYWGYVSNMNEKLTKKSIMFFLISICFASFFAILEHFNFSTTCGLMGLTWNNSCWAQDVQNRVFSTFGQPNWLAAAIVAFLPVLASLTLFKKKVSKEKFLYLAFYILSITLFITLLFTKSRSGLLGFAIADIIFWGLVTITTRKEHLKQLVVTNILFVSLILLIGTPWSPSVFDFNKVDNQKTESVSTGPALETGGTESGVIRKIVWEGAIKIWKEYPVLGTGPETFAFAYPMFKPIEHNLTTEWDFIYNKAHNEYLNYLATTGILGLISYLVLIGFIIYQLIQNKSFLGFSLLAGFISILITNFFGFSVVSTSLIFFLFPAMAVTLKIKDDDEKLHLRNLNSSQKLYVTISIITSLLFLFFIARYWIADIYYNRAHLYNKSNNSIRAREEIDKAINLSPNEAIFWSESSIANSDIAVLLSENNEYDKGLEFTNTAISESEKSTALSQINVNLIKTQVGVYYKLLMFDDSYLAIIENKVKEAISISPNDPKLYYQLGLINLKLNEIEDAISNLEIAVYIKPNYRDARYALGSVYKDIGEDENANENFRYILEKIAPDDEMTKKLYN